jgi:hypothetical protein
VPSKKKQLFYAIFLSGLVLGWNPLILKNYVGLGQHLLAFELATWLKKK